MLLIGGQGASLSVVEGIFMMQYYYLRFLHQYGVDLGAGGVPKCSGGHIYHVKLLSS